MAVVNHHARTDGSGTVFECKPRGMKFDVGDAHGFANIAGGFVDSLGISGDDGYLYPFGVTRGKNSLSDDGHVSSSDVSACSDDSKADQSIPPRYVCLVKVRAHNFTSREQCQSI